MKAGFWMLVFSLAALSGCGADQMESSSDAMRADQDAALKDPFSYGPVDHHTRKPVQTRKPGPGDTAKTEWDRLINP